MFSRQKYKHCKDPRVPWQTPPHTERPDPQCKSRALATDKPSSVPYWDTSELRRHCAMYLASLQLVPRFTFFVDDATTTAERVLVLNCSSFSAWFAVPATIRLICMDSGYGFIGKRFQSALQPSRSAHNLEMQSLQALLGSFYSHVSTGLRQKVYYAPRECSVNLCKLALLLYICQTPIPGVRVLLFHILQPQSTISISRVSIRIVVHHVANARQCLSSP